MDSQDPIQKLCDVLAAQEKYHEPWTSGVVNLSGSESTLFFKCKDGLSQSIELGSTTGKEVKTLIDACDPATFGRGPEKVLDETYRKAWKLDEGKFSWLFSADSGKSIAQLARGLCPWDTFDKGIRAEPYKLNVYGKGGFFKTHQATPRAENMFGSLVFALPFEHQGGNLVLRHRTREFNFNVPTLLRDAPPSSVAYVAFYSDVEHEVLEVTDGHRVTITFSLYFDPFRAPPILPELQGKIPENPFTTTLREVFRDAAFIRKHEYLAFGLEYDYPIRKTSKHGQYGQYEGGAAIWYNLERYLKGPDAFLFKTLEELGLKPQINYLFGPSYGKCRFWVMCDHMIQGRDAVDAYRNTELEFLMGEEETYIIWVPGESEATVDKNSSDFWRRDLWVKSYFKKTNLDAYRGWTLPVTWVTTPTNNLAARTKYTETGNEEIYYFKVCVIVDAKEVPCPQLPALE